MIWRGALLIGLFGALGAGAQPLVSAELNAGGFGNGCSPMMPAVFRQQVTSRGAITDGGVGLYIWPDSRETYPNLNVRPYFALRTGGSLGQATALDLPLLTGINTPDVIYVSAHEFDVAAGPSQFLVISTGNNLSGTRAVIIDAQTGARPSFPVAGSVGSRIATAFNGSAYLVATGDVSTTTARRYGTDGALLDATPFSLDLAGSLSRMRAAAVGSTFLVISTPNSAGSGRVRGVRVSGAGVPLDTNSVLLSGNGAQPSESFASLAAGGGTFLAVWISGGTALRAGRLGTAGGAVDPGGLLVATGTGFKAPEVEFDGTNFVILWSDALGGTRMRRLSPAGVFVDAAPLLVDPLRIISGSAGGAGEWQALMTDTATEPFRCLWLSPHKDASPTAAAARVNPVLGMSSVGRVAYNGGRHLLVWRDESAAVGAYVRAQLVLADGSRSPAAPVTLNPSPLDVEDIAVAPLGAGFVVAFDLRNPDYAARELYAVRLDADATPLDPAPVRVASAGAMPTVAEFAGRAWIGLQEGFSTIRIVRMELDGGVLGPDGGFVARAGGTRYLERPSVASDGVRLMECDADDSTGPYEVRCATFAPDSTRLTTTTNVFTPLANRYCPAVAAGNDQFAIAWLESEQRIRAGRVSVDAGALDSSGVVMVGTANTCPAISRAAGAYLVVAQRSDGGQAELVGRRLADDGTLIDAQPWVISSGPGSEADPSLALTPSGSFGVVSYTRSEPGASGPSVYYRLIGVQIAGGSCNVDSDCAGQCVQLRCTSLDGGAAAPVDGGTAPDAGGALPDGGGTILEDGGVLLPDGGGVLLEDGGVLLPDGGGVLLQDGGVLLPDGGVLLADGGVATAERLSLNVGCGCGAFDGAMALLAFTAVLLRRRRTA